ncbi:CU044_5270 family protein [Actinomadura violacea]|uniref:CU044_5270 family protein n=1 Tax=Actinomadura violacea TaxID=2819934 RepID=A0ABS3RHZ0_9ACTN|nr:CU044_5270 family protein [Actinomadura violacea]MBO2456168.1 CU044_5270 family protein [Actinomadura violacea]
MDDLKLLGTALAGPDPSADAVDRSRHRLQNTMRGGGPAKPRRARRWIMAGAGLTAAAAAAAIVVSDLSAPDSPAKKTTRKEQVLTGPQVMLAAATTAEAKPATSGTYWHIKTIQRLGKVTDTGETWFARDGRTWLSAAPGLVSRVGKRSVLREADLGIDDFQRLPTDPARLKAALLKSSTTPAAAREQPQLSTINLLQAVLSETPAPPKVRAAAFRALAGMPHIDNLGKTADGYRLKITYMSDDGTRADGTETIVVDPKSTQLRVEGWAGFGDGDLPVGPSQTTSGWTNDLPGRLVPWSAQEPYIKKQNEQLKAQHH